VTEGVLKNIDFVYAFKYDLLIKSNLKQQENHSHPGNMDDIERLEDRYGRTLK
jgi:hypothetical protein